MSLAIATAFGAEYQALWSRLANPEPVVKKDEAGYAVSKGSLFDIPVHLLVTGMGRVSVDSHLSKFLERFSPSAVLVLGFCGGLSHSAKLGTVSIPDAVLVSAGKSLSPELSLRQRIAKKFYDDDLEFLVGDMITVDKIIETAEERKKLNSSTGAVAVDMEAYYVAEICQDKKLPWFILKTVMDDLETKSFSHEALKPGLETAKQELSKVLPALMDQLRAEWRL